MAGEEEVEGVEVEEAEEEGQPPLTNEDVARGEAVVAEWQDRLSRESESPQFIGANGARAAHAILAGLHLLRSRPGLEEKVRRFLATYFNAEILDDIEKAALALYATEGRLQKALLGATRRRVSEALLVKATTLRAEMMHVFGFEAAGDATRMALHADFQRGRGTADLANDMHGLSTVWIEDEDLLKKNHKFKASDGKRAAELAGQIRRELAGGLPPAAVALRSTQARLFNIAAPAWFRVASAMLALADGPEGALPLTLRGQMVAARG